MADSKQSSEFEILYLNMKKEKEALELTTKDHKVLFNLKILLKFRIKQRNGGRNTLRYKKNKMTFW